MLSGSSHRGAGAGAEGRGAPGEGAADDGHGGEHEDCSGGVQGGHGHGVLGRRHRGLEGGSGFGWSALKAAAAAVDGDGSSGETPPANVKSAHARTHARMYAQRCSVRA